MKEMNFDELIQGYIDGNLSREEKKILREHLRTCSDCRKKLNDKKRFIELIKDSKEDIKPPEDLVNSIITLTTGRRRYVINWKYVTIGAAALLIISILLFTLFRISSVPVSKKKKTPDIFVQQKEKGKRDLYPVDKEKDIYREEKYKEKMEITKEDEKIPVERYKYDFEETRFVFPEEGAVVGNNFDVVIILNKPGITVELDIDGEKRRYSSGDSSVLYVSSDSLPALENGLHTLSLSHPEKQSITFYKEG